MVRIRVSEAFCRSALRAVGAERTKRKAFPALRVTEGKVYLPENGGPRTVDRIQISYCAGVAQQVERILGKDEVGGPSPLISSIIKGNALAFPFIMEFIMEMS